jgi:hypothetical protein
MQQISGELGELMYHAKIKVTLITTSIYGASVRSSHFHPSRPICTVDIVQVR